MKQPKRKHPPSDRQRFLNEESGKQARFLARVRWDRQHAKPENGDDYIRTSSTPALSTRFQEKSGEKAGIRRRRFLAFLRAFPLPRVEAEKTKL